ncbi:MAG: C40 family peptidase [Lachnospiraceae bacterium]|nr:C40 family peptidase [Lachnospiraceae bacterium]
MKNALLRTIVYTLSVGLSVTTVASRTVSAGELYPAEASVEEREFSLYGGAALSLGEDIEAESSLPVCGAALSLGEDLTAGQLPYIPAEKCEAQEEESGAEEEPAEAESADGTEAVAAEATVNVTAEAPAAVEAPVAEAPAAAAEAPAAPAAAEPVAEPEAPAPEAEEPAAEPEESVAEPEEPAPEPELPAEEPEVPVPEEETPSEEAPGSVSGQQVADFACQFIGGPYKYGGCSLTEGADCSGFVMAVYAHFGVSLPHSSTSDRGVGRHVDGGLTGAVPGDIICYGGHVGIYIGNGQIVHAFNSRKGIVTTNADYDTVLEVRRIF